MSLQQGWITVPGRQTFFRHAPGPRNGAGTPVIVVHGQGVSSRFDAPLGEALARHFPVWLPDQPGFGQSEGPKRALDVNGLADFLAAFMDAVGIVRAALVGTSFGCQVTVAFALRHGSRASRIVLQGPAAAPRDRGRLRLVKLWRQNGKQEPSDLKLLASEYRRAGFRRVYDTFSSYRLYPVEEVLCRVEAPALAVRGRTTGWCRRTGLRR